MSMEISDSLKSQLMLLLNQQVIESQPVYFEGKVQVWYWSANKSLNLTIQTGPFRLVWKGEAGWEYQMILEKNNLGIEEYYNTHHDELERELKSILESLSSLEDFHFDYKVKF